MPQLTRHPTLYFQDFQESLKAPTVEQWLTDVFHRTDQAKSVEDWKSVLLYWNEIKSHIETHFEKVSLAFNRNTQDVEAEAEERRLHEEIEPPYKKLCASLRKKVLNSPFRKELEKEWGPQYFIQLQIQQDAFHPQNVDLEIKVNQILSDYTKLTGSAEIIVSGKKYPLAHYKKFSSSPQRELRRESLQSYSGWYLKNREALEEIYESCVNLRTQMGKQMGHENYIPLAYQKMRRTDYGPAEVGCLRKQIKKVGVPLASQIRRLQAKSLQSTSLQIYDADYFPEWKIEKLKVDIPEQVPTALKVYEALSPTLGRHFQKMIELELIDVPARAGKAPGAFCTDFSDYRVPFIFLNSVEEASDITTLLHESGHAFQAWESSSIDLLELRQPTLEACEVHSMGMEFLAHPYYDYFFSSEEAKRYRKYHLAESILLLPYIAVVDEFQHRIYSEETTGPSDRAKAWEELEKEYLPDLDYADLPHWRPIRWLRQLHIFKHPFYYIDYAIALIGALQLWVQSTKNKEAAMENYLNLCKVGGTLSLKEFFKAGNLRLPFEEGVLKELMEEVLKIEPLFE